MKLKNTVATIFGFLIICSGCVDIEGPEMEPLAPDQILSRVRFSSSAAMIAEGDSLKVGLSIYAMNGEVIPFNRDSVTWSSSESKVVGVSPDGTIHALKVSDGPILVTATYNYKYVTKSDTVSIYVTNETIDANEIRLISIDSNRVGQNNPFGDPRVRVDLYKNGNLVQAGALVPVEVDLPAGSTVDKTGGPNGELVHRINNFKSLTGKFMVRSSINMYGNEIGDSLEFKGLYNAQNMFNISQLEPSQVLSKTLLDTLPLMLYQTCYFSQFWNSSQDTIDIVFSDSTASSTSCAPSLKPSLIIAWFSSNVYGQFIGGNIISMPPSSVASRQSNTQGTVVYKVRKSSTKEYLPFFTGHFKQVEP